MPRMTWRATLSLVESTILRLEVWAGAQRLMLALLPYPPEHVLALRNVLEGLSLWQGAVLYAVHAVDVTGTGLSEMDRIDGLYVPPSPLVDVVVQYADHPGGEA